jgi:hypothetical protein
MRTPAGCSCAEFLGDRVLHPCFDAESDCGPDTCDLLLGEDRHCIGGIALLQASVRAGLIRRIGKRPRTVALHLCGMRLNSPLTTQGTSIQRHRGASAANASVGNPELLDLSPAWAGYRTDNRSHRGPLGRLPLKMERGEENVGLVGHLSSWPILTTKPRGQTAHWDSDGRPLLLNQFVICATAIACLNIAFNAAVISAGAFAV